MIEEESCHRYHNKEQDQTDTDMWKETNSQKTRILGSADDRGERGLKMTQNYFLILCSKYREVFSSPRN